MTVRITIKEDIFAPYLIDIKSNDYIILTEAIAQGFWGKSGVKLEKTLTIAFLRESNRKVMDLLSQFRTVKLESPRCPKDVLKQSQSAYIPQESKHQPNI